MTDNRRWLRVAAVVEAVTLAVLLLNRLTVGADPVAGLVGPVHGSAYLAVIALAWLGGLPRRARLLALVPGIGGLLADRAATAAADRHG
jgi:hypothetical protein